VAYPIGNDIARGTARDAPCRPAAAVLIIALLTLPSLAQAEGGPPGLVSWSCETCALSAGEAVTLQVVFDNLPLRRFTLLVESGGPACHLNVRRDLDGSLLYDTRDEVRHEVDVPWGIGESLTAVLTAGPDGGSYAVSFWGPPPEDHKRAYSYDVNRALEAYAAGNRQGARDHCRAALQRDPADAVARLLMHGLDDAARPAVVAFADSTGIRRGEAAVLVVAGRLYEALTILDEALAAAADATSAALVLSDLGDLHRALGNLVQARISYETARNLGLPPDLDAAAAAALTELPAGGR
jgi:hypothetical protein